jgi:PIN domain nuclease of toxin-antitoxin system
VTLLADAGALIVALPGHHKDPIDRMLIAAAIDRGMTVLTDDAIFARYRVATL